MTQRAVRPKRPTLDDVAALAQVSRMVASRAINGTGSVSPAASARVMEAVDMLGYVVHQGARSLATNRTGVVAFLAPMQNHRFFADPNVAQILGGINEVVRGAGSQLVTLIVEDEHDADRVAAYVRGRHVDGVMVLSPELVSDLVRRLAATGTALSANGRVEGASGLDAVVLDTEARARDMAHLLWEAGSREVVVIAGPREDPNTSKFITGVQGVYGMIPKNRIEHGAHSYEEGASAIRRLLEGTPRLEGVLVASDVMAGAVISHLIDHGVAVPGNVRVTGWDDSTAPVQGRPGITTLHIPYREVGRQMARMLLEQINGLGGGRTVSIDTRIVRRESA